MDKELFAEILGSLEQRRDLCQKFLGGIYTTTDLSQISLARAAELKRFCVEEETIMTKICMVDLYHIIGMGRLSPTQMMKFTYLMQDYLSYRPAVKVFAQKLDRIEDLPKLPVKTKFRLLGLGNATLTYGEGDVVDEASVDDYTKLKAQPTVAELPAELPFTISGSKIQVDMNKLDLFTQLMEGVFNTPLSVDNLRNKINNRGEYLGIAWIGMTYEAVTGIWAIGNMSSNNTRQKIIGYFSKRA